MEEHKDSFGHLQSHFKEFQNILNTLDEIRNLIGNNDEDIKIPTVVVIGDQSHGKSSLMELISGVDLPRNQEICTRVPAELRLRKCNEKYPKRCVYISAKSDDKQLKANKKITFDDISKTIEEYTNKLVPGNNKESVADKPINLTIYDHNLPNLTLIDLPGLIHNDDDNNKIKAIKDMVKKYIEGEQSIIVNVLNCTNEAANAESLKLSKDVDPERKRTLLVLTKIDMYVDSGLTRKFNILIRKENFPQDRVFLVRNRTQKENEENVSLHRVQQNEIKYLEQRKDLSRIPPCCKGSIELTKCLVKIQKNKMFEILPNLRETINNKIDKLELEKEQFVYQPLTVSECRSEFRKILKKLFEMLK
eukprot:477336_1